MSIQVSLDEIPTVALDYGGAPYVLVSLADGPPRITHSLVRFESGDLLVTLGRRSASAVADNPLVSVLWPAAGAQPMSLIVDGVAVSEGGQAEFRIKPTSAVRHRPASG